MWRERNEQIKGVLDARAFTSPAHVSALHFAFDDGVCAASARLFAANERPFRNIDSRELFATGGMEKLWANEKNVHL
jgi:hypothetical protein